MSGGVGESFRLKGAEAGPDGATGPWRVVRQAFLTSVPASHTLTSTAFHMLCLEINGEDGGRLGRPAGIVMVMMTSPLLLLPPEEILVAKRNTSVVPV